MPEIILPIVFVISLFIIKIFKKEFRYTLAARIAMSAMLITTGIAHFVYTKGMTMMLPDFLPFPTEIIHTTGILEILGAIGILIPKFQRQTAWLLIYFFIAILPANIFSALKHVNMETATYDGEGLSYLWFRIPLQIFFIGWVYFSCLSPASKWQDQNNPLPNNKRKMKN